MRKSLENTSSDGDCAARLDKAIAETADLVERYRARCFWFLREDWRPATGGEALRAVAFLQRYGDREAFLAAAALKPCLSPPSSRESAAYPAFVD